MASIQKLVVLSPEDLKHILVKELGLTGPVIARPEVQIFENRVEINWIESYELGAAAVKAETPWRPSAQQDDVIGER